MSATFCFFGARVGACIQSKSALLRAASASSLVAPKNGPRPELLRPLFLPPAGIVASTFADQRFAG